VDHGEWSRSEWLRSEPSEPMPPARCRNPTNPHPAAEAAVCFYHGGGDRSTGTSRICGWCTHERDHSLAQPVQKCRYCTAAVAAAAAAEDGGDAAEAITHHPSPVSLHLQVDHLHRFELTIREWMSQRVLATGDDKSAPYVTCQATRSPSSRHNEWGATPNAP
jgi:hypothetical protein